MTKTNRRGFRIPKITRDAGIYLLGIFILLHQTLIESADRPTLIYAACALLGLPIVMRFDEARSKEEDDEGKDNPPVPTLRPAPRTRKQEG